MTSQIGKRASRTIEEWPVPKSSTESADAGLVAARRARASAIDAVLDRGGLGDLERERGPGAPWRRSAASTRPGRSGSERFAVARLTRCRSVAVAPPVARRSASARSST